MREMLRNASANNRKVKMYALFSSTEESVN